MASVGFRCIYGAVNAVFVFYDQQLCLLVEDKIFHMLQLHVGSVRVLRDILPDSAR